MNTGSKETIAIIDEKCHHIISELRPLAFPLLLPTRAIRTKKFNDLSEGLFFYITDPSYILQKRSDSQEAYVHLNDNNEATFHRHVVNINIFACTTFKAAPGPGSALMLRAVS